MHHTSPGRSDALERRRHESEEHGREWTTLPRGPFETVKIHALLAIELVASDRPLLVAE
jgi:hypothetical protein